MRKAIAASISAGVIALATLGTASPASASWTNCSNGGDDNLGRWQVCYTVNGDGMYVDSVQGTAKRYDGGGAKSIHIEYVKAGDVHWRNTSQVTSNNFTNSQSVKGNVARAGDYCAKLWVAWNGGHYWAGQACVNIHP